MVKTLLNPRFILSLVRLTIVGMIAWVLITTVVGIGSDLHLWDALGFIIVHTGGFILDIFGNIISLETALWLGIGGGVILWLRTR